MPSVAEYQQKYDEISEICKAAKNDFSMSNAEKRRIATEYEAARTTVVKIRPNIDAAARTGSMEVPAIQQRKV
ncbi:unnamed protein product [Parascedosporium putredinis]|uniref:Uncharacterized protein n=1 Tax=Parascedosporium putredinis TaxID=1442378 RepID=A0A9P1MA21_9PEZI|nr:unnamed protein product [Parascedosporium putredinis]CAI7996661.1 unnamed protein product [Parascedosporium putredinis]